MAFVRRLRATQSSPARRKEAQKKLEEERQTVSASLYEQRARREELLTSTRDLAEAHPQTGDDAEPP